VKVSGLDGASAIAAGESHSLALQGDGTVWAWGSNFAGQLGDGTTTSRLTPVKVSGLKPAIGIAAGAYHSLAITELAPDLTVAALPFEPPLPTPVFPVDIWGPGPP
jgi:alpha-tubulin suppressor-like RCC1 family protein